MTKSDIVDGVCERLGSYSKKEAAAFVENTLNIMKAALTNGEYVKVTGFGTFSVQSKKKRRGRNPKTGKALEITARKVCKFKTSPVLRELMNS